MLTTKPSATPSLFTPEEAPGHALASKRRGLRLHWEDALWVAIVGGLTGLWVVLLMSPAWH